MRTSCVQWADLREPTLFPKTWKDNQENQNWGQSRCFQQILRELYILWLNHATDFACFRLQLPSSLSQKLGSYVSALCFHVLLCVLKEMNKGWCCRGTDRQTKVWLRPFFLSSNQTPLLHSIKQNAITPWMLLFWKIISPFFLPNQLRKISRKKTPLHLCVYISVYIGALWCIYFCFSWSVLLMCCSGICIGQALVFQTPKFYISPV